MHETDAHPEACEVYAEPRHRFRLRNEWTNIYEIELPHDEETLFHRHSEDTVYFVVADAEVRESFPDKPAVMTNASAGGTMCRTHKHDPLIHQVRNVGKGIMHMVGAEALARPPTVNTRAPDSDTHEPIWDSERFRAFSVATTDAPATIDYDAYGILLTYGECTITNAGDGNTGSMSTGLSPGGFIWLAGKHRLVLPPGFRGTFAQWI